MTVMLFFKFFDFEQPAEFGEKLITGTAYKLSQLMYKKSESEILNHISSGYGLNGLWNVRGHKNEKFYIHGKSPFPRLLTTFEKVAGSYLPIEYVQIPDSDYQFVKRTPELCFLLEHLIGNFTRSSRYSYYATISFSSLIKGDDVRNSSRDVYTTGFTQKAYELISNTCPYGIYNLSTDNDKGSRLSDGTRVGYENIPLRDFTYYIQEDENRKNEIFAVYADNPKSVMRKWKPDMQELNEDFEVSKKIFSNSNAVTVIGFTYMQKLDYAFKSTKVDSQETFELLVNAINELAGYKPFLENSDGGYAHKIEDVVKKNYDTDGYMVMRASDLESAAKKTKKAIDKETAKNNGACYFLMRKK